MPLVRKWRRLGFTGQLIVLLSMALVVIGGLVVAVAALAQAAAAGHQAKATANCVNTALGDRNGPSARDAAAHITFAQADKRASDALTALMTLPNGSQAQRDAYDRFVVVQRQKDRADAAYVRTLVADQRARDARPLGRC